MSREPVSARPSNPNKALWQKGDFTRIAESMRQSGEALVTTLGVTDRIKVLDLGCGDGTTAVPAARLGADVLGVDIASNLVEAGKARAQTLGLTNLRFQEGDASDLSELEDDCFDLVISMFGAMFAPRPFDVAKEMVRVTRPGGRIVMGNWIPNDPTLVAQILKISSSYSPPPPEGFVSPMTWGVEDDVIERFGVAGVPDEKISFERDTYTFNFPGCTIGISCPVREVLRTDRIRLHVLEPGEPNGLYHSESEQEDFLVLSGECRLLVEGEERLLRPWDFFHSPAGTAHIFVGAGDRPCVILMAGARSEDWRVLYPVSELAARYGASAEEETSDPDQAYVRFEPSRRERPSYWDRLPWA